MTSFLKGILLLVSDLGNAEVSHDNGPAIYGDGSFDPDTDTYKLVSHVRYTLRALSSLSKKIVHV